MTKLTALKTQPAGRAETTQTTLAELIARLQDELPGDAAVVAAVTRMMNQGRLRRDLPLDLAA
ncbi:MAG: hypothetical protein V1797_10355 [Pseudomonadota bacterium]